MDMSQGNPPGPGCPHTPPCPAPSAPDRLAAHTIASHPEQGWSLLCNGVVVFDDGGALLPAGPGPARPGVGRCLAAASTGRP